MITWSTRLYRFRKIIINSRFYANSIIQGAIILEKNERSTLHPLMEALNAGNEKYSHFLKLDEEKQERVLAAAYNEFLEKGYGEASTNIITQKAGISKGLLFHYFGNKEGLYKFLMRESVRRVADAAITALPIERGDVFIIIKSIIKQKITVCLQYPRETSFTIATWQEHLPTGLLQERENLAALADNYSAIMIDLLDNNLLRDDVEKNVAAEIIAWVCEKYTDKMLSKGMVDMTAESWKRVAEDLDKYMNALWHGLYK